MSVQSSTAAVQVKEGRAATSIRALETIPSTVLAIDADLAETIAAAPATGSDATSANPTPNRSSSPGAGRYAWVAMLGEGGMGRVDRMRDQDLLRDVAVKHLLPELRSDPQMLGQFLWESRVTSHLDHPNIVPVHDLGTTSDGQLYFTMKFVRGRTLEDEIERWRRSGEEPPMPLQKRIRLFLQICNAISYAHAGGVLHRDLKPANVLLGEFGEVLVSDWGLAVALPGERGDAMRTMMPTGLITRSAGTPVYMSPEQTRGEQLDERSDLYTLGAILYEVITLRRAFGGGEGSMNLKAVLKNVGAGLFEPITTVSPSTSPTLAAVVMKAMSLAPADRYPSAAMLALDIETVLDGRTPEADKSSVVRMAARYYLAHDPAIGRLRVIDIDSWLISAALFGGSLAAYFASHSAPYWWLFLIASAIVGAPSTIRWLLFRREHQTSVSSITSAVASSTHSTNAAASSTAKKE